MKESGHQPWTSSKKMHYLRLSKGRRKPTGQEIAASVAQTIGSTYNDGFSLTQVGSRINSAGRLNEGFASASSVKHLPQRSKIFTTFGPDAHE